MRVSRPRARVRRLTAPFPAPRAPDLLNKGYVFDYKVSMKTKTANGVKFNVEGVMKSDKKIAAKFSGATGLLHGISLDKLQVDTAGSLTGELGLSETGVDGLEASFKFQTGLASSAAADHATVGLTYKNSNIGVDVDVDAVNSSVAAAALVGYEGFVFGGSASVETNLEDGKKGPEVSDYSAGVGYRADGWSLSTTATNRLEKLNVGLYQQINSDLEFGVLSSFSLADPAKTASIEAGSKWKVDSEASMQTKVNNKGIVSLLYKQQLNKCATLTTSAAIDATKLETDNHKLGLYLAFE